MTSLSSSIFMVFTFFWSHNLSEGTTPVFVKSFYIANLNESSPIGTHVITVKANDPTQGHYVTYSLQSDDNPANKDYFEINSTSGDITIAKIVDREEISQTTLKFYAIATDNVNSKPGKARVVCQIFDINDNYPVFENLPYEVNISEATRVGEVLLKVTASDRDTSADFNNEPVFRIEGGNTDDTFRIGDTSGEISLQNSLDYETHKIYHLNVTATDKFGRPSGNTNWTLVTVMVTNEDDNPATFSELLYEVQIEKDFPPGVEALRVHAEDQDSVKDPVFYSIFPVSDPEQTFLIINDTGSITVNKNLTQNLYNLIVTAKSTHHSPAFALVKVFVGPTSNRTFVTSVPENKANIAIFDLRILEQYFNASDPIFSIIGRNDDNGFAVNSSSKEVLIGFQGLDREKESQYSLVIEMKSEGKHRGFAKLIVTVLDINDNAPVFKIPSSVSVREDSREGTVILTVTANDRDAGANGTVTYEIITGNEKGLFALNNQSGAITLARQLDYETAVQHVLNISASDAGEPQRQTFTDVIIHVTDVNDNSPVLRQRIVRVSLFEDIGIGSLVTEMNATDADDGENGRVTYEIIAEDVADKFAIDSSTGAITTIEKLDRETEPEEYTVVVVARDNGSFSRSDVGVIFVTVTNKNEHSPVISPLSYVGGVYKETSYYSLVTTVKATDADAEGIGSLSYELVNGNGADLFHVESRTGHVRTTTSLADLAGKKYTLTVGASDGGNPVKVSAEKAIVDIFVLQDEDAINVKVGVGPHEITKNRTDFLKMLKSVTEGQDIFIKHLREENEDRATLVTFHAVKDKQVMTADTIISSMFANKNLLDITFKKWNVSWFQSIAQPSVGARVGTEERLSATVGAMICFGVMMFVFGIILLIILVRRKRAGKSPFRRRRSPRVTFKEEPEYIDSYQTDMASNQVEADKEASEIIPHEAQEDGSSLEESGLGSTGSNAFVDVLNFVNFGYSTMAADDSNEVFDSNNSTFVPPPPRHPPPKPPSSDEESDEKDSENDSDSIVLPDAFRNGYDEETNCAEMFRGNDGIVVLSESPSDSITGSTEQLVNDYPKISFVRGSVLKQFSSDENTTEL